MNERKGTTLSAAPAHYQAGYVNPMVTYYREVPPSQRALEQTESPSGCFYTSFLTLPTWVSSLTSEGAGGRLVAAV